MKRLSWSDGSSSSRRPSPPLAGAAWLLRRPPAPRVPPSVLLVTIDTLRADRVGAYGGPAGLTPNIDALAAQGAVFEEALASVPLTLPSHATILSGLEPPHHGVRDNGTYVFPEGRETLATRLQAAGYATGAFMAAYVLDRRFGLARGFTHYDDAIDRRQEGASILESERRGETVVAAAEEWLGGQHGPYFAWVHLYDPHAPYDPPSPFREKHAGALYDGEVAYADACVGRLLEAARRPAAGNLVVVVLSDHGESLGEHGERTHGFFVYQSTLRIPLIAAGPGVPTRRVPGLARTADVTPTILRLLGMDPLPQIDGMDLLAAGRPRESYAETLLSAQPRLVAPPLVSGAARSSSSTRRGRSFTTSPTIPMSSATSRAPIPHRSRACARPSRGRGRARRVAREARRTPRSPSGCAPSATSPRARRPVGGEGAGRSQGPHRALAALRGGDLGGGTGRPCVCDDQRSASSSRTSRGTPPSADRSRPRSGRAGTRGRPRRR